MAKRAREEATAVDKETDLRARNSKRKRSKQEAALTNPDSPPATAEQCHNRNKKKKQTKHGDAVASPDNSAGAIDSQEEKAAKKARRALKRAKREAPENAAKESVTEQPVDGEQGVAKEDFESVAKAARKEEKRKRKAEKAQRKSARGILPTPDTSTVPSTAQSSATSPEPPQVRAIVDGYTEDPELTSLPQANIDTYLSTNFIAVSDPDHETPLFRPITSFKYLPSDASQATFATFTAPTPVQAATWPFLLAGRDVVGVAETGSGKTLAFGVPCIRYIMGLGKKKQRQNIRAVIISPTRELAVQICEQMVKLAAPVGLGVVCVYGGVPKEEQRKSLKTADIVVATPGRLDDLINEGAADLSKAGYLVLDEADRMLDKGFEDDIRKIISETPRSTERQTLMFTATWPESIRKLAATFMTSPVKINIGDNFDGDLRANVRITQQVEVVEPANKNYRLIQLLKEHQSGKQKSDRILIFCLYKKEATRVESFIRSKGFRVAGIHGDLSQSMRTEALEAFKSGKVPLLVATDVAARGLDIPAVKVVINVTFPLTAEDYVHRIGRTGRAGQTGKAVTLFTEHDKALSGALINVLKAANQPVPDELLKFGGTVKKKGHEAYGAFYKDTGDTKKATKITFD